MLNAIYLTRFSDKRDTDLVPISLGNKDKIRLLLDKGWTPAQIQRRRYHRYTARQIGAVRGWMRRGKY
jgi:hypothetical protein